jgi:pyruvate dehydrogenase E2 component (dihydrolipoamide acetyltransferase)
MRRAASSEAESMPYDVVMPQLGMTMTEGMVVTWLKQPGDPVERGEPLFVVQTDKVDMDVEATAAGRLQEILLEPGQIVAVGTVIAKMGTSDEGGSNGEVHVEVLPGRRLASPRARRLARELGIDIAKVEVKNGDRIVEADVRRFADSQEVVTAKVERKPAEDAETRVRSRIAERMTEAFATIPHFYLNVLADVTELVNARAQLLRTPHVNVRITYTDFLIKALALALRNNAQANVSWRDGRVIPGTAVHIGVAAQFGERLLVPVIRNADQLNIVEIARARTDLVERGKANRLSPDDLQGASCTLSNLGMHRVDQFNAVINPPESAILAAGRIALRPFVVDRQLAVRETIALTLSVDHRVIDGVAASQFLESIVTEIENPLGLLLNLKDGE